MGECISLTGRARDILRGIRWAVLGVNAVFALICCGFMLLAWRYPQFMIGIFVGAAAGVIVAGLCASSARSESEWILRSQIDGLEAEIARRMVYEAEILVGNEELHREIERLKQIHNTGCRRTSGAVIQ